MVVKRKLMSEINVVPYIDVMLVLLVVFIVTAPLLSQGVQVDLPKAQAKMLAPTKAEPIVVTVDSKGYYYLNIAADPRKPLSPVILANRVAAELMVDKQQNRQRQVLVRGDQHVPYGTVITAMVLLQRAGCESVGLMTEDLAKRGHA